MSNFVTELKRRHIYRVAAAYAVVAWVLIQLVSNVSPMLRLPDWAGTFILVLLLAGFPVALLFAWIHQLAPENTALGRVTTGKLDWFLAAALVVVIALVSYQQLAPQPAARIVDSQQTGVAAARAASATQASAISIAVLPFVNLSGDTNQEFFSDGMTEEITAVLAKIPDLRVVGRTSAFQFKGQNQDLRAIGQALTATHLLEGSVRMEGNRLRITAQLILADNGVHVWTESYDRELTGVFAIQEDIATAIAGALRMPLGLAPGERVVINRAVDPKSYQQYLRAKTLVRSRGGQNPSAISDAIKILEQAVARDPDFAPAWGFLGTAYRLIPRFDPARQSGAIEKARPVVEASLAKAEAAAQRALRLDPKNSDALQALGDVERMRRNYTAGVDLYLRALALDPDNPDVLNTYSVTLAELGYLKQALPVRQRLRALEPYVPLFNGTFANMLWADGQTDAALALSSNSPTLATAVALSRGRYGEAADILQTFRTSDAVLLEEAKTAARLLRTKPAVAASPQSLPPLGIFGAVYLYVGAPERVLDYHEGNIKIGYRGGMEIVPLWSPPFASIRKTERFKAFVRNSGMVDYWRARGWPDHCQPVGTDDFACD